MQSSWLYSSIWRRSESSRVCIHCSKITIEAAPSFTSALPLEVEEGLELLQPVARPRGAEAVADDAVEVDEDLAAEEVVELALAGAVAAHQPLERGDLVGGVVVDVQVGVAREPLVHEVDERLERDPLGLVVVRVERLEVAVDVEDPPEVLERAVGVPERVALEVEEEVAGRGVGQEREAGFGLRLEEPVGVVAGLARDGAGARPARGSWPSCRG